MLVFDSNGSIVDSDEDTYYKSRNSASDGIGIKPFLAKTVDFDSRDENVPQVDLKSGYKVEARVLDFRIVEE